MLLLVQVQLLLHLLIAPTQLLVARTQLIILLLQLFNMIQESLLQTGHLLILSADSFLHRVLHNNFKVAAMGHPQASLHHADLI